MGTDRPLKVREAKSFRFPAGYGDNKIVLLVRDPWWIFTYWEISPGKGEAVAKETVQGKEIKLRSDGTFTLRFALPDGKQVIPVEATSKDGIDHRRITPIVTRKTE